MRYSPFHRDVTGRLDKLLRHLQKNWVFFVGRLESLGAALARLPSPAFLMPGHSLLPWNDREETCLEITSLKYP